VAAKAGWCRLCRLQLAEVAYTPKRGPVPVGTTIRSWQLMLGAPLCGMRAEAAAPPSAAAEPETAMQLPGQLALFPIVDRDYALVDRNQHANPANLTLIAARRLAEQWAEQRGWPTYLQQEVDVALRILLSDHAEGDTIRYSRITPLDKQKANVGHTAEILTRLGILEDDRGAGFAAWLDGKLAPLAPGLADDVGAWATALVEGTARTTARTAATARGYLRTIHPLLIAWSADHDGLRALTSDDIRTTVDKLTGVKRKRTLVALRSLFGFCKKHRRIFRDPTARIRIGNVAEPLPLPLQPDTLRRAVAAATTPAQKLVLALAAIHAARPAAIRELTLDDLDVPNRRITIGGHSRRLDELTCALITDYLRERRRRWPHTGNRHLLLTERTAHDDRPASDYWLKHLMPELPVPLNKIRMDRQVEEALSCGPDPLRLAAVFGIAENTAVRYANAARQLLESEIEQATSCEPTTTPMRTHTNRPGSST
jgi:site-specific recombinase XerD